MGADEECWEGDNWKSRNRKTRSASARDEEDRTTTKLPHTRRITASIGDKERPARKTTNTISSE